MPTRADNRRTWLEAAVGQSGKSIADLEWLYYSARSGLSSGSLADHKFATFAAQGYQGSIGEREFSHERANSIGSGFVLPTTSLIAKFDAATLFNDINPNKLAVGASNASSLTNVGPNSGNPTITLEAGTPIEGTSSIKVVATAANAGHGMAISYPGDGYTLRVVPGDVVTALATVRQDIGIQQIRLEIRWGDVTNALLSATVGTPVTIGAAPVDLAMMGTAPANAAYAAIKVVWNTAPAIGDTMIVDKIMLAKGYWPAGSWVLGTGWTGGSIENGAIDVWRDTSGVNPTYDAFQKVVANKPVFKFGPNGPGAYFDAVNDYLKSEVGKADVNGGLSVYSVWDVADTAVRRHLCDGMDNAHRMGISLENTKILTWGRGGTTAFDATKNINNHGLHIISTTSDGVNTGSIYQDGQLVASQSLLGGNPFAGVTIGADRLNAYSPGATIYFLAVYNANHDVPTRQSIENYLKSRYGVS